jgi:hypothetical protein
MDSKDFASEPTVASTYGMSAELRNSGLLNAVDALSNEDKTCLVRYIHSIEEPDVDLFEDVNDEVTPYTMEELNARIDEVEAEIAQGHGKSFDEMKNDFKKELLWLK